MITETENDLTGAEDVIWDLGDLYSSEHDPSFLNDLENAEDKCRQFSVAWKGRLAAASDNEVLMLLGEFEQLQELLGRLQSFTYLKWTTNTEEPANGALLQSVREVIAAASRYLVFFSIELRDMEQQRVDELKRSPVLGTQGRVIEIIEKDCPYMLNEDVEQALAMVSISGKSAWVRLHNETISRMRFEHEGREYNLASMQKLLTSPDREVRKSIHHTLSRGLDTIAPLQAYIYNTIMADRMIADRLRGYPHWLAQRNNSNEVTDTAVENMIQSVIDRYDIPQRYYRLKARLLKLPRLALYDRSAPLGTEQRITQWDDARKMVIQAYENFDSRMGGIVGLFFENSWIHAPVLHGKSGGAYSASTVPSAHPYIFLNYSGTDRDVQTLAHELGHGVHQYLSRQHGLFMSHTPLTVAETASVFGELITFSDQVRLAESPRRKVELLTEKIGDSVSTVFRQVALNRFENAAHNYRRDKGELSLPVFTDLWQETQGAFFGDSVEVEDSFGNWWTYISHFFHTPGYVYAYAYGELLVKALYKIYQSNPSSFVDKYYDLLAAGGSKSPNALFEPFGLDLNDVSIWKIGLEAIDDMLTEAEVIAAEL